jgi:hypothetical protein
MPWLGATQQHPLHRLTAIHGWSIRPEMNRCPLPRRSANILTGYCRLFQGRILGGLGPMSVIEVRIYTLHDSQQERQRKWDEFYGSKRWRQRLGPRANPLMKDSSNVIAVEPTPGSAIQ